jgi:hypothetical protein
MCKIDRLGFKHLVLEDGVYKVYGILLSTVCTLWGEMGLEKIF